MISDLRQKKKFDDAFRFINVVKLGKLHLYDLIHKMTNN